MESYQLDDEYPNVIMVPLNQITIGEIIIKELNKNNIDVTNNFFFDITAPNLGNLSRLQDFSNYKDRYPPVKLKSIIGFDLYRIIDGRHRVTISIIRKYSHVPAIIDLNT